MESQGIYIILMSDGCCLLDLLPLSIIVRPSAVRQCMPRLESDCWNTAPGGRRSQGLHKKGRELREL